MRGLTKGEQIISQGMQDLINLNRESNKELRQLRDDSPDLKDSIKQNIGEILATVSSSIAERRVAKNISKSTNMGIGVTKGGKGVDAGVDGGEPKVLSEKETLFGITQKFYGKNTFEDLIKATTDMTSMYALDPNDAHAALQEQQKRMEKEEKEGLNKPGFFKRMGSGFFEGSGLKSFFAKTSKMFGKVTGFFKGFTVMKLGKILGAPFKLVGGQIMKGLKGLKNMSMKLLGKIKDGILALPKKLMGFLGGAFSVIAKIALILLAVVGLSKLIKFLRGISPEERDKFVQSLIDNTKKLKTAVGKAADYITDVLLPALRSFTLGLKRFLSFFGLYTPSAQERAEITTSSALENLEDKRARFANMRVGRKSMFKTEQQKQNAIDEIDRQIETLKSQEFFDKVVESEEIKMRISGPGKRKLRREGVNYTEDATGVIILSPKDKVMDDLMKDIKSGRFADELEGIETPIKNTRGRNRNSAIIQQNQSNDNSVNISGSSSAFQLALQPNNFHYG